MPSLENSVLPQKHPQRRIARNEIVVNGRRLMELGALVLVLRKQRTKLYAEFKVAKGIGDMCQLSRELCRVGVTMTTVFDCADSGQGKRLGGAKRILELEASVVPSDP